MTSLLTPPHGAGMGAAVRSSRSLFPQKLLELLVLPFLCHILLQVRFVTGFQYPQHTIGKLLQIPFHPYIPFLAPQDELSNRYLFVCM